MFSSITSVTAMPDEDLEDYSLEDLRSENSALREKLKETFLLLSGDSARNREYDSVARELEIEKNHTKSLANTVRDLERELAKCNARLLKANLDAVNGVPLKTRIRQLSTTINDQTRELNTLKRDHEENVREKINIISDNQSLKSVLIAEKNRIEFLEKGKAQLEEDYKELDKRLFRVGGSLKKEKEIAAKTVMMLKKEQIRNMEMASEVFHLKQLLADLRSELKGLAENHRNGTLSPEKDLSATQIEEKQESSEFHHENLSLQDKEYQLPHDEIPGKCEENTEGCFCMFIPHTST